MASLVLTDANLFRHIAAFQRGLPLPLYDFWRTHKPPFESIQLTPRTIATLVHTLVQHGTPELFDVATRVTFSCRRRGIVDEEPEIEALALGDVATIAFRLNRPDILEWALVTKNSALGHNLKDTWYDAITRLAPNGGASMLDVLKKYAPLPTQEMNTLVSSVLVSIKHVGVLRWVVEEIRVLPIPPEMLTSAINRGDLPILEFLYARGHIKCDPSAFYVGFCGALFSRRREVLEFLVEHYADSLDEYTAMQIITHTNKDVQEIVVRFADRFQHVCTKWLSDDENDSRLADAQAWVARGLISPHWPISIDSVAANGNFGIVQLLQEEGIATATTAAMDRAAENGDWDLVDFLHYHRSEGCTSKAMAAAIKQERFDRVKFLLENCKGGFPPDAAQLAASNQTTSIVRFLHFHTNVAFSPAVMDAAAARGSIAVVKFLHEHRSEGCTTNAMDYAAGNGHLQVVQFLHVNRSEGCTFGAVSRALEKGSFPVVQFLVDKYPAFFKLDMFNEALVTTAVRFALTHNRPSTAQFLFDHFPCLFAQELLPDLLLGGMFNVYTDLQSRYPDDADSVISSALYEAGRSMKLQTIRFVVDILGRQDLAYRAMDGAASLRQCGTDWLRAVHLVAGAESCRLSAVLLAVESLSTTSLVDPVKFLIRVCCEADAKQFAIDAAHTRGLAAATGSLTFWNPTSEDASAEQPLHPFLLDPRVPSWVIERLLSCTPSVQDPYGRMQAPLSWAIQAVYEHDLSMLEVIRDTAPAPWYTHASHGETTSIEKAARLLNFAGAHAAAIRVGNLEILQWLIENVEVPAESTLLEEAAQFDKREIAQWLLEHHAEACERVHSHPSCSITGPVSEDKLDWLEATSLIKANDADALRRVHTWYPELLRSCPGLAELAKERECDKAVAFLEEIEYNAGG